MKRVDMGVTMLAKMANYAGGGGDEGVTEDELLKLYSELLARKRAENDTASLRLQNGSKKWEETTAVVDVLKESIAGDVADAEEKKATSDKIAKVCAAEKEVVEVKVRPALPSRCARLDTPLPPDPLYHPRLTSTAEGPRGDLWLSLRQ